MGNLDGPARTRSAQGVLDGRVWASQYSLTFENLFDWLETQHSRGEQFNVKEAGSIACGFFLVYSTYYTALSLG